MSPDRPGVSLGIDLGATKALAVTSAGSAERRWPTGRATGPGDVLGILDEALDWVQDAAGPVDSIGIGFPGIVDDGGRVVSSVMLDGWDDVELATIATAHTGLPTTVDNDVNCAALAEAALRGGDPDLIMVTAGTGIGGAVVLGGRVWRGVGGLAGEIGHTSGGRASGPCDCGGRDCLHRIAGGRAIDACVDRDAARRDAAAALGTALADAASLLAVPLLVVGGGLAGVPGFVESVSDSFHRQVMSELSARCRVEPARAGEAAGALGAAALTRSVRTVGPGG